ncbi:MAG: DNA polymerase III subunit alpha, partial [Clostridia bacterium]|nr:DNA polymerase III subunit alpha [Clostridia bacterium]
IDMELLRAHHDGLIALSGCIAGKIPRYIIAGDMEAAEKSALEMKEIFGDDFYLEVQNHGLDDERKVTFALGLISEKYSIPLVATNDVHYLKRTDADTQAILMCVQTNNCITDGRPFGFETDEFYFKSTDEMKKLFPKMPSAIENTVKIAEKCNFDFEFDKLHLPDFKSEGLSHRDKLYKDAYEGLDRRIKEGSITLKNHTEDEYIARIKYELEVIDKMGFNAYFLIVADFVNYAKRSKIPVGPGRGSGAGSLVAFCIGITNVDPLEFDLLFERFLNPERVSMPDFDIDFCFNRREEVIDYVKRKYGEEKVAQIVTFGTLAARAAVRDAGRALGMPYSKVDTVAKLIPRDIGATIEKALESRELSELYRSDTEVRRLIDISRSIEGMPRHASTHAAGVVITEKPTHEYVPLSYSGTGVVTQYDMTTDAKLGLVKFDFLGLRYLTIIDDAVKAIKERNPEFALDKIPYDDKATFELLQAGKTDGIFQLESGGMKQVLSKLMPTTLEDVIATIALYRPGPMDSIDTFIARKHGVEKTVYKTPLLADILDVTYGCIVYQEQVMQICRKLAGYSYARADIVRRAMSKKKTDAMIAEREAFVDGCLKNGVDKEVAEEIFEDMVSFAKYAFNKSHATAYAIISYQTAYLKVHYPTEYFASLLTGVLDSTAKLREYISDARTFGVQVKAPDINFSRESFSSLDGTIRFGLLAIKNVGRQFAAAVINERKKGSYKSFGDFVARTAEFDLNKRTLESLIKAGVFDALGVTRSSLMSCYEAILESEQEKKRNNVHGQMDFFTLGAKSDNGKADDFEYPDLEEYSIRELLLLEKESSGMYFSGHMLDNYKKHMETLKLDKTSEILSELEEGAVSNERKNVRIGAIVTAKRTKVTKNGDTMAFLRVDDKYGEMGVIVFAKNYRAYSELLGEDSAIIIEGYVNPADDESEPEIVLTDAKPLMSNVEFEYTEKANVPKARLYVRVGDRSDGRLNVLYRIASLNPGGTELVLYESISGKYLTLKGYSINPTEQVIARLGKNFGTDNVILK